MNHQYKVRASDAELYGQRWKLLEKILQHPEEPIMGKKIYEGTTWEPYIVFWNWSSQLIQRV